MSFEEALKKLEKGKVLTRKAWNGKRTINPYKNRVITIEKSDMLENDWIIVADETALVEDNLKETVVTHEEMTEIFAIATMCMAGNDGEQAFKYIKFSIMVMDLMFDKKLLKMFKKEKGETK